METKSLVQTAVAVLVAVVVFATVLVPVTTSAQQTIGPEVTYSNPINSINQYHYDYLDNVDVVFTYDTIWHVSVNGSDVPPISDYMLLCLSETVGVQYGQSGTAISWGNATDPFTTAPNFNVYKGQYTIAYHDKHVTVSNETDGVVYGSDCAWFVTVVDDGEYIARNGNPTNFYTNGEADGFILYSGGYTTGELDTFYAYGNGELSLSVGDYSGTVNFDRGDLVDGTTDVYRVNTVNVTITDGENSETFTPYRALVKETIHGHESGGAAYTLVGIIPLLVIVGLILAVVGVAIARRYDL